MPLNIQIRHLRAYQAIMNTGTVTGAAEFLNLTQPAVSRLLATLEAELGFKLFYRRGGRLMPSVEGRAFYHEIEGTLDGLNEMSSIAEDIKLLKRGRLRLVAIGPLTFSRLLPDALAAFSAVFPDTRYSLEWQIRSDLEEWVASRQVDLGFTLLPVDNPSVDIEPIVTVAAVAILPADHPKAAQDKLTPEDFRNESVILPKHSTRLRHMANAALIDSGVTFPIKAETSTAITSCHLVATGMGIGISDPFSVTGLAGNPLRVIRWEPEIRMTYGALWPKDRKPSYQALKLIEIMREVAEAILAEIPAARPTGT